MIVITGAFGFIGSCLVAKLNAEGYNDLILIDDFSKKEKEQNLTNKKYSNTLSRKYLFDFIAENHRHIQFIFHLGARTDTAEINKKLFDELN